MGKHALINSDSYLSIFSLLKIVEREIKMFVVFLNNTNNSIIFTSNGAYDDVLSLWLNTNITIR